MAKTLTRDTRRAVVGGVAAGFGSYLDVDPVLVRVAFVALAFANGFGILLYLIAWVVMPRAAGEASSADSGVDAALAGAREVAAEAARSLAEASESTARARLVIGYGLIALGAVLLLHNLDWIRWPTWARLEVLWPLLLVAAGAGLVQRSLRKEAL